MAIDILPKKVALSEYLAAEESAKERLEYHNGQLYRMPGGTFNHTLISMNVSGLLWNAVRDQKLDCIGLNSEIKIEVDNQKRYVYPDAGIVCRPVEHSEVTTGAIRNPVILVEVLSKDSGTYDTVDKFKWYFDLPSLQEYLIISQTEAAVVCYRRAPGNDVSMLSFNALYAQGLDEEITLASLSIRLPLKTIYQDVIFPKLTEEE